VRTECEPGGSVVAGGNGTTSVRSRRKKARTLVRKATL